MKTTTRQKAVRAIISALSSTEFSPQEIKDVALALNENNGFATHVSYILRKLSEQLIDYERSMRKDAPRDELVSIILNYVDQLALSQRNLLMVMSDIEPEIGEELKNKRYSTRDLVMRYLSMVSETSRVEFLSNLQELLQSEPSARDSYLDHITRKLE